MLLYQRVNDDVEVSVKGGTPIAGGCIRENPKIKWMM